MKDVCAMLAGDYEHDREIPVRPRILYDRIHEMCIRDRYTATEEMIAMGGGELFGVIEQNLRHKNIEFPGHAHADLYDVATISGAVTRYLLSLGIQVCLQARITKLQKDGNRIVNIEDADGNVYEGDVFIDTTGTAGPMNNCSKYGNGCAMCVLRCPSFCLLYTSKKSLVPKI